MKVVLSPGDRLEVVLEDSDGSFYIDYDHKNSGTLEVLADLPDTQGRMGSVYCEEFNTGEEK